MIEIQTGTPPVAGRYVVFVQCQAHEAKAWTDPHIATWHNERWAWGRPVLGWLGPLPVASVATLRGLEAGFFVEGAKGSPVDLNNPVRDEPMEYDL